MSQLPYKSKKKTKLCDKNSRKCGEITFCLQLDTRVYALRCLFCPQIFIQWDSFISHMEEEHDEELRSDHLLQQEIEEVNVEADISKEKKAHKQASVRLLKELPQSNQMSVRTEFSDGTSIEDLLDICDPLEEIEAEKSTSIKTTAKSNKYCFVPDKSFDTRIVNQSTLDHSYERIDDQNNSCTSGEFQYTPTKTSQKVYGPQSDCLLLEMRDEIKTLKSDIKKEITELKDANNRSFTKLTEEIIAVKLENRNHHDDNILNEDCKDVRKLPFGVVYDLEIFDEEVQKNEDKLRHFKQFIAKTGGEGPAQFIRAAVRKVFSDELASSYSWKGTSTKPSAEKCFLITTIKNICHLKFKSTDKEMNAVLQRHFVHAKERLVKRKRPN